jgi:hypothetical protein
MTQEQLRELSVSEDDSFELLTIEDVRNIIINPILTKKMVNYTDLVKQIQETLVGRPEGHEILPAEHQQIAMQIADYIRQVELSTTSTLTGFAEANTYPIQPSAARVCYIGSVPNSTTVTFTNFIGSDGNPISITTASNQSYLVVLLWNTQYWEHAEFPLTMITNNSVNINVVQTEGTSTSNVMSQNAVTNSLKGIRNAMLHIAALNALVLEDPLFVNNKNYTDTELLVSYVKKMCDATLTTAKTYSDSVGQTAINTAATDATNKANNAKNQAINTAASDATTKANNAKSEAISSSNAYTDQNYVPNTRVSDTPDTTGANKKVPNFKGVMALPRMKDIVKIPDVSGGNPPYILKIIPSTNSIGAVAPKFTMGTFYSPFKPSISANVNLVTNNLSYDINYIIYDFKLDVIDISNSYDEQAILNNMKEPRYYLLGIWDKNNQYLVDYCNGAIMI